MISVELPLTAVAEFLSKLVFPPPKPGAIGFKTLGQVFREGVSYMKFKILLPEPGAADVTKRKLSYQLGPEADFVTVELAGNVRESDVLEVAQDTAVVAKLVDVDDAGNESPERTGSTVIRDTIPPPQPGELGFETVGE